MISSHKEKYLDTRVAFMKWRAIKHLQLYGKGSPESTREAARELPSRQQDAWLL